MTKITFRPMQTAEYPHYRDYFIPDYATEIEANYGYSPEKSLNIATQSLIDDLPQGAATPDQTLLCIEDSNNGTIGYLWYKLLDNGDTAFIYDFVIFEAFRGQGYGKSALLALEKQLLSTNVQQIKLRVAYHNKPAFGLYEKIGFNVTGYNMIKILEAEKSGINE
jgi:ribosomal protein S18 acetylase RimI-like enzyme